ncbi:MAG: asparagine synthase (glutamine-hydrolyzing) [Planctomycetota bacterium]
MCGIAGYYRIAPDRAGPLPTEILLRMRDVLAHRGPDDAGIYESPDGRAGLAHRRLAILDLSPAGRQPMSDPSGRLWISFNGEIYNYLELRRELEAAGHAFRTGTDTEVLLAAWLAWEEGCLERLNGMWAFALWDGRRKILFCSRDRFGIKPFYYSIADGIFIFASEIRGIFASGRVAPRPDRSSIATYLTSGVVDGLPETFFENIRRLPPASCARVTPEGLRIRRFWRLSPGKHRVADPPAAFRELLGDAVNLQMRSDVPVGTLLSGGLDSSSILALASDAGRRPMKTFTSFFPGPGSEGPFARAAAAAFHAEAEFATPPLDRFPGVLENIVRILEEPPKAPGVYPHFHVMWMAAGNVKVLLDGQGGDEVLAGYDPYRIHRLKDLLARTLTAGHPADLAILAREDRAAMKILGSGLLWPWFLTRVNRLRPWRRHAPPPARGPFSPEFFQAHPPWTADVPNTFSGLLDRQLHGDLTANILPQLLKYEDKLGMAFSLECRVPYLDHRIVEFAFALADGWRIRGGWSKFILRKAMDGILPREVAWRRDKQGFPFPVGEAIRMHAPLLAERLSDGRIVREGLLPGEEARRLVLDAPASAPARETLWKALCLEIWFSEVLPSPDAPPPSPPGARAGAASSRAD